MSRPHLGYSNWHWIRQDQKAAQKKYSELKTELNSELIPENTPDDIEESLRDSVNPSETFKKPSETPTRGGETDDIEVKTQDFCDNHGKTGDAGDAGDEFRSGNHASTVGIIKDSCKSEHEVRGSKHESVEFLDSTPGTSQESFSFVVPVRDGEVKSDGSPSLPQSPRIDSWLPAPVPETDK